MECIICKLIINVASKQLRCNLSCEEIYFTPHVSRKHDEDLLLTEEHLSK